MPTCAVAALPNTEAATIISVHVIMALVLGGPESMRVVFEQQQQHRRGKLC